MANKFNVKVVTSGGTFAQTTGYGTSSGSGGTGGSSGPTITLGTSSGSAGSPVGLTGSGFADSSTLTVTFNNAAVTTSPTPITSTSTGAIPSGATFTVPTIAAGLYTVTVTDGSNPASASFTVSGPGTVAITITSSTVGAGFITVDGTPQTTPYVVNWVPAATHTIAALSPVAGPTGTQYLYTSWSDGAGQTHTYTVPTSAATVTANFQTQYQVTFAASPSAGGTTTPSTPTWYNAGASAQSISATANSGYSFTSWSATGSITVASSTSASTTITVNSAGTVTATFTAVHNAPTLDVQSTSSETNHNSYTISLTTSSPNDIIYIGVATHTYTASVSGGGLTWTQRGNTAISGTRTLQTFWALKTASGSITVTITLTGTDDSSAVAFAVNGANTASPFDTTNPIQNSNTGTGSNNPSASITTTNANDFIVGVVGVRNNPITLTTGSGFTSIGSVTSVDPETGAEYKAVTTTQTNLSVGYTLGSSNNWAIVVDAIKGT